MGLALAGSAQRLERWPAGQSSGFGSHEGHVPNNKSINQTMAFEVDLIPVPCLPGISTEVTGKTPTVQA